MATKTGKGASAAAAEKGKGAVAAAAEKGKGGRPTAGEPDADDGKTVKLKSSDEQIFEVPAKVAKQFKIIADVVDRGCADATIPLPNVDSSTLAKVVEYCENHLRMNAQPDARIWDKEFVGRLDVHDLFDVVNAANYLDYERLLDLTCKAVAKMMAGKTVEQIRATFGIENDFAPEEEAAMHEQHAWAFQD